MRNYTLSLAIVGLTGTLALGGCSVATYGPSSDAYATGEGGPAVPREPEAPVVLTSDTDVRVVQQRLAQLNHYPGRPDGVWGSDVQASVEDFQRAQGLKVAPLNEATLNTMGLDPVPLTRRRPIAGTSGLAGMPVDAKAGPGEVWVGGLVDTGRVVPTSQGTPPARISSLSPRNLSAAGVSDVQEKLSGRGFYRAGVDGIWGPRSDQALRDFQGQNGLFRFRSNGLIERCLSILEMTPSGPQVAAQAPSRFGAGFWAPLGPLSLGDSRASSCWVK